MSSNVNIPSQSSISAPTPQNTPLTTAPISHQLSRPTVPDIQEGDDEDDGEEPPTSPSPGHNVGRAGVSGLGPEQTAILTQLVQGKLSSLVGKSSGYIESLPVEVKRNVEGLKGIQIQFTKLQKQHKMEVLELERKYLALYNPLFDRRYAITSGAAAPTRAEVTAGEAQSLEEDPEYVALPPTSPPFTPISPTITSTPGIPQFWLTALRNHVGLSDLITDRDAEALKYLTDIRVSYLEGNEAGFKLTFFFEENEFFSDKELTKTYVYRDELGYEGDFVFEKAIGCEIKWKEEKDLTKSFEIKKQRNKNTNRTRLIRKAHPTESFFNFFSPPTPPDEDAIENGEVNDDELEDIEERLELDFQIGEDFKERIIPRAVDYFTGKALEYEDIGMDDEDDDDEFDEDDEDEDDEEEDSDDEEHDAHAHARKPPRRTGGEPGAATVDPKEDCKQQ
ncbi:nucleosome assembly protein [Hysterangium stoloniferum]|nr:nucleosome assembly protein [Hysterangium stoloniferum]